MLVGSFLLRRIQDRSSADHAQHNLCALPSVTHTLTPPAPENTPHRLYKKFAEGVLRDQPGTVLVRRAKYQQHSKQRNVSAVATVEALSRMAAHHQANVVLSCIRADIFWSFALPRSNVSNNITVDTPLTGERAHCRELPTHLCYSDRDKSPTYLTPTHLCRPDTLHTHTFVSPTRLCYYSDTA